MEIPTELKFLDSGRSPQYCFEPECAANSWGCIKRSYAGAVAQSISRVVNRSKSDSTSECKS